MKQLKATATTMAVGMCERAKREKSWFGAMCLGVWLVAGLATGVHAVETGLAGKDNTRAAPPTATDPELKWGIKVIGPHLSGGGNLVDFRYQILDATKAAPLTKLESKASLVDQVNGARLIVPNTPKLGSLRQTTRWPEAGKVYFMIFANTRHRVKEGDKVTVTIGECTLENLVVE
jgi:hypothetical protein